MEIRQLKYFVSIAELGSFSEASRRHFLSQSAISQQIKALEEEYKTTLFIRTPHKVELTESGQMLLPLARQVLQSVNDCEDRMSDVNNLLCGELNIGLSPSFEHYARKAMIRFMKTYPHVLLNVNYMNITHMRRLLAAGQIDVCFAIHAGMDEDLIESLPVTEFMLYAILRDTHPLANREELTFKDLERQALILPERDTRNHNAVEEFIGSGNQAINVRAVINDPHAAINMLKYSNCISILTKDMIRGIEELKAIPIRELNEPMRAYAHISKKCHRKRSMEEFLRIMKEVIGEN